MKTFKFEIILTDEMLEGDEYWEDALQKDGTGISTIMEDLHTAIRDQFFPNGIPTGDTIHDLVKLKEYTDV